LPVDRTGDHRWGFPCSLSAPSAIPLAPQKPTAPPQPPTCFDKPTAEFEHFLEISVELGGGFRERPIWKLNASGTYFAQQQQVGQQFIANPSFSSDEAIRALLAKQPKYGPEKKQEFIAALPWREIEEITGCRLQPQTAKFVPALGERKYHTLPALQWWVSGTSPGTEKLLASSCRAAFDAFEGRLTDFYD
jgi:hypothetical protein